MTGADQVDEEPRQPWARRGEPLGDARQFGLRVASVQLIDGHQLILPGPGVTAIVGANNSGKSTLLRQLRQELMNPGSAAGESIRLVTSVQVAREGRGVDFVAWLREHAIFRDAPPHAGGPHFVRGNSGSVQVEQAPLLWEQGAANTLFGLAQVFVHFADAHSRLAQVDGTGQRGDVSEPPTHPLHYLQDDAGLRHRLAELSQRIFRTPLTLDHLSGMMRLRVGQVEDPLPGPEEGQASYRAALARLRPLEQQGDGMKSLLGLLLPLITATYPIILVDEPEAFLHPPQAFQLGRALGELARESRVQLVLATHDRNLLAGLLAAQAPLSVVRLTRHGDTTEAAQLPAEQLAELWTDPVLRYSNVLDGLFHQLVVLGEAERDCRFYGAALDAADETTTLPIPAADVLFVPANGKAGMARLASALRAVAVEVVASPDLDILNDRSPLEKLVTSLGSDWAPLQDDYAKSTAPFRGPREPTRVSNVRTAILQLLDEALKEDPEARYGPELAAQVRDALRSTGSPWQALKDYGTLAFKGDSALSAERLLTELADRRVVAVRVGELEGFAPGLGIPKGKRWLPAALDAGAHRLPAAQMHVRRLLAAGGYQ